VNRRTPFALALVLAFLVQVGLVGWLVADRAMLLASGREVRLAVVPIDPRDLLRGDYVVLGYEITRLESSKLAGDTDFAEGDPVYVTLAREGDVWSATAIAREPPKDGTWIRGTISNVSRASGCSGDCTIYRADYNIEKFFVPEGTGHELEQLRNDQRITVDVALGDDGRAALKRLLVDGEPRYEEPVL
jgi:uncharacterized membrane-anchored protein